MAFSSIAFGVVSFASDGERFLGVSIKINGADLIKTLKAIERPFAAAEGAPQIAGAYSYLSTREAISAFMPDESELDEDGRVAVLDCECGNPGCWPFMVRIQVNTDTVTWSDFAQLHRDDDPVWDYSELGQFTFSRIEYERAFRSLPRSP